MFKKTDVSHGPWVKRMELKATKSNDNDNGNDSTTKKDNGLDQWSLNINTKKDLNNKYISTNQKSHHIKKAFWKNMFKAVLCLYSRKAKIVNNFPVCILWIPFKIQ